MNDENNNSNTGNGSLDPQIYISTRQSYDQAELEVSGRYDKWILTFSGGALGLSITFIEKIAKNPTPDSLLWLKISWACLILSLLTALLSLLTSQSALRENRKELDLAQVEERAPQLDFPKWFTWTTNGLNWSSLALFVLGTAFLCIFSFKNIDSKIIKGGNENVKKTTEAKNYKTFQREDRRWICPFSSSSSKEGTGLNSYTSSQEKTKKVIPKKLNSIDKDNDKKVE